MKRIFIITCALSILIFTNCKKKADPAPAPVNISVSGNGSAQGPPGSVKSGTLSVAGKSQTFDVLVFDNSSYYSLSGTTTKGTYSTFVATFNNGKPTTGQTIDFSTAQTVLNITIGGPNTNYSATSGTAVITVNNNKISVNFTNVIFTPSDASANISATGAISSSL
jgi:hypothetical protein